MGWWRWALFSPDGVAPSRMALYLPLLIFPCTIKSRSSLLAPARLGGPGKRAIKRLWWWCGVVGQKTCMHVHGVFPYVFVRCNAAAEPPLSYLHEFAAGLDKAINAALGNVASTRQHVYKISLVSGMSVSVVLLCVSETVPLCTGTESPPSLK